MPYVFKGFKGYTGSRKHAPVEAMSAEPETSPAAEEPGASLPSAPSPPSSPSSPSASSFPARPAALSSSFWRALSCGEGRGKG